MNRLRGTSLTLLILLVCAASPAARAAAVGVRIYIDPWNPQHPAENSFQTYYDDPTVISRNIIDAWESSRQQAVTDLQAFLAEHDIGGGFRTYDTNIVLNPISDFSIAPSGSNGAIVKLTVPQFSVAASFRTPGPAPNGLDPRFSVAADLVISVDLEFGTGDKVLRTASVSAVVRNVKGPDALNDSAQAIKDLADIFNAMVNFVTGIDFEQSLIGILTSQDLAKKRLQPLIDANLQTLNNEFQSIPQIDLLVSRHLWADRNRLTLYAAPKPLPAVPLTGSMTGRISWKSTDVTGSCSAVKITASVQLGPQPLLQSDGLTFGAAPTQATGRFNAAKDGLSSCTYTLSALGTGLPNALQATTSLSAVNSHGSTSQYVGQLHTTTTISPVGWSGDYVTPNASSRIYVVTSSMTAGGGIGALQSQQTVRIPNPGQQQSSQPGVASQFNQSTTSLSQLSTHTPTIANTGGAVTTMSYNSNSTGMNSTTGSGVAAAGFTLPAGNYLFEYVNEAGETKKFHAKVNQANGGFSIAWGKKEVSGVLRQNRFASNETRTNGTPVLQGMLTANGAMSGTYMAESNGKIYAAAFTLKKS
jgi:hypothetical protein